MIRNSGNFRIGIVLLAWALSAGWLFSLFVRDRLFGDPHGYGSVLWSGLASIGLAVLGTFLTATAFALHPKSSRLFAAAVLLAPAMHAAGAAIDAPGCYPLFLLPTIVIVILGVRDFMIIARSHDLGV